MSENFYTKPSCMKSLLTISLFIITLPLAAQLTGTINAGSNQVYIIDPRIPVHDLKKYTSVFVDSSNKLTLQEIASEKFSNLFQSLSDSIHQAQPYITYWLKVSLSSSGDIQNWWLLLNEDPVNKGYRASNCFVDGWALNNLNRVLEHQRTGLFVPRSQKMIKETPTLNRIYFSAKAGQTKNVYLRIYNEYDPALISFPQLRNPTLGMLKEDNTIMVAISSSIFVFSILSFFFFLLKFIIPLFKCSNL